MPLRIVKASDPLTVENINLCLYAPPGVGKTTLGFSAEKPLLLDFDKGAYRAANRRDSVTIDRWEDVGGLDAEALKDYKTIVVDTAGRALDRLTVAIIAENPKLGRNDGSLTLQGFGVLKARFSAWLKLLNSFGKDVILIAHMDEQRSGDDVIERLDVQGGSKGEIYKSVDAMGRIFIQGKQRVLDFSPRENAFGKNPGNLDVLSIPAPEKNDHFMADTIADIKDRLNAATEEQRKAQEDFRLWEEIIGAYTTAADFNRAIPNVKKAPKPVQAMLANRARAVGMTFDKKAKLYVAPQRQQAEPEPEVFDFMESEPEYADSHRL